MSNATLTRCLLTVEAETDHTVSARILNLLTVRGDIPAWFSARKLGGDGLRITLELHGAEERGAALLARKIRNLPTVLDVEVSWLTRSQQIVP